MFERLDLSVTDPFDTTSDPQFTDAVVLKLQKRLLTGNLLGCRFADAPHVRACVYTNAYLEAVGLTGGDRYYDNDWWQLLLSHSVGRFAGRRIVHVEGDEESMWRDLAVLLDSDFAVSHEAPAPVDAGIDLSSVRERLNRLYETDHRLFQFNGGFLAAPHVTTGEFGDVLGLMAHRDDEASPDWWQAGFRTDGVPWYHAQDWVVSGNVARMQHDLVAILMGDFTLLADLWRE